MNIKAQQIIKDLTDGTKNPRYTPVYTPFLQIPAHILNSNEKIILTFLKAIAPAGGGESYLDFSHDVISMLTGIPLGTINRIMPTLQNKVTAADKWLRDNNFKESWQLNKLKNFASATIYNLRTISPPIVTETSFTKSNAPAEALKQVQRSRAANKKQADKDHKLKIAALQKTGFDIEDLESLLKYDIERINRNVKYFLDKYRNPGRECNINLLRKCFSNDYGKIYLSDKQKAVEYLLLIKAAIDIIMPQLNDKIQEQIKKAYKFDPPASIEIFTTKSDVKEHYYIKTYNNNSFTKSMKNSLMMAADYYMQCIKNVPPFHSKGDDTKLEIARLAAAQIVHNVVNMNELNQNNKAA